MTRGSLQSDGWIDTIAFYSFWLWYFLFIAYITVIILFPVHQRTASGLLAVGVHTGTCGKAFIPRTLGGNLQTPSRGVLYLTVGSFVFGCYQSPDRWRPSNTLSPMLPNVSFTRMAGRIVGAKFVSNDMLTSSWREMKSITHKMIFWRVI